MKIGILDENAVKKIADLIVDLPETINVFVDGSNLEIESVDVDSIVEHLESNYNLHLIVNGNKYMVASLINEGLAEKVAEAGAKVAEKAADMASGGAFSKTKEMIKKDEDIDIETSAEKEEKTKEETKEAINKGEADDVLKNKVRGLKSLSDETSDNQQEKIVDDPEVENLISDPNFVKFMKRLIDKSEEE